MTIQVDNALPPNVVEIGNEITQGVVDGLMSASPSASSSNPYLTVNGAASYYLPLAGGTMANGANIVTPNTVGEYSVIKPNQVFINNYIPSQDSFSEITLDNNGVRRLSVNVPEENWSLNYTGIYGFNWTYNNSGFSCSDSGIAFTGSGVVFPDSTVQTTAAVSPDLTPYLQKADNLASLTSSSNARTNLGLGSMAVETASNYLTTVVAGNTYTTKANNLSDLTSASNARTALGLGNSATNASTAYLQPANNLSELTSASNARTALGLAYATDAQVIAGTSASTVMTPAQSQFGVRNWVIPTAVTAVTSVGSVATQAFGSRCGLLATASGQYAIAYNANSQTTTFTTTGSTYGDCNFSKRIKVYGRIYVFAAANINCYYAWGRTSATVSTIGSPASKGFGIRIQGTGAVELQVHDGTNLTNVTSSFTPASVSVFDCLIDSLGNGTVNLYINGSLVATSTAGPTGSIGSSQWPVLIQEISSIASSLQSNFYVAGKALYLE